MRVSIPSLDSAKTYHKLQAVFHDTPALSCVLSDIFHDSSATSADTASIFLERTIRSVKDAERVAEILKSYAGAIPLENAVSLANISSYLAVFFDSSVSGAALHTFAYAEPNVTRAAIRAACEYVSSAGRASVAPNSTLLSRVHPFFTDVVSGSNVAAAMHAIHAIATLPAPMTAVDIAGFMRTIPTAISPFAPPDDGVTVNFDISLEETLYTTIARGASSATAFRDIVINVILRAVEFREPEVLHSLYKTYPARVVAAVSDMSLDVFLFLTVVSIAGTAACCGQISAVRSSLVVAADVITHPRLCNAQLHPVVVAAVSAVATSIASIAAATALEDVTLLTSRLFKRVHNAVDSYTEDASTILIRCAELKDNTTRYRCPATLATLSLMHTLLTLWSSPSTLFQWLSTDVINMMRSCVFGLHNRSDDMKHSAMDYGTRNNEEYEDQFYAFLEDPRDERSNILFCLAITVIVSLDHSDMCVRMAAARAFSQFPDTSTALFSLPAILVQVREEKHPAIAVQLLKHAILNEALVREPDTAGIALATILRIMKSLETTAFTSTFQTIVTAVARAAKFAPGRVTKIIVNEIEVLRSRFDLTRGPERIAGAAAILTLAHERPARAAKFVPFITLCLQPDSINLAPEAAALCLDAMYIMSQEEVMDPLKTVKIIMKKLPSVLDMNVCMIRSFLRLLGVTASGSQSKKGRSVAESVITLLRDCLTKWTPDVNREDERSQPHLSWGHVSQATLSLTQFPVDDILRISHRQEDPQLDLEAERLRLQKIEEECADFMTSLLDIAQGARGTVAEKPLETLFDLIAKHEWKNRPRGNFDPERIAKLRAASEALRRSRMAQTNSIVPEEEGISRRFLHAVEGMPSGVIKVLCARSGQWDPWALRAATCAVTTALPWPELLDEGLQEPNKDISIACLHVLWANDREDAAMGTVRNRWFLPDAVSAGDLSQTVEIFLGCATLFPDRLPPLMQLLPNADTVLALINTLPQIENNDTRIAAVTALLDAADRFINECTDEQQRVVEEALAKQILDSTIDNAFDILRTRHLTPLRARLACKSSLPAVVRVIIDDVVSRPDLTANESLLRDIGAAVGRLSPDARRSAIRHLAESPSHAAAIIATQAIGATGFSHEDVHCALTAGLVLCKSTERVAVQKLADWCRK